MVAIFYPPPPPQKGFKPIDKNQFQNVARNFDTNRDGKLSGQEMDMAANLLKFFGEFTNNDKLTNMGTAFSRLSEEIRSGNRNVDIDGDKQLDIYIGGRINELDQIASRNNFNQLEEADLKRSMPVPPRTNFDSISSWQGRTLLEYADRVGNRDGKASVEEMKQAQDFMKQFGLKNYSNVYQRMIEEVEAGNRSVDSNGDKAISFRNNYNFPPGVLGLVAPSEYDQMVSRNNPNQFEVKDLNNNIKIGGEIVPIGNPINVAYARNAQTPSTDVAKTQQEWKALLEKAGADPSTPFDPNTEMAVGIFMGSRATGGYSVKVSSIREENGKLIVEYEEKSPGPNELVTQAFTSPATIVKLPKSNLPVEFRKI